jgi:2-dehydro-3-deoxyphosphogluconate aldolase/(4S)-4-hydroxy-2-oxoglutarate aldolase
MQSNEHQKEVEQINGLNEQGILPMFYHPEEEICINVVRALAEGGMKYIEFTNRGENALENFKKLVSWKEKGKINIHLCAGTIKTPEQAHRFIEAGAEILISPVFDSGVADVAYMEKVLWIPGCMTPTEIHLADSAGCNLVKLFPGELLKPPFIKAVRPLFPGTGFIVTGGVELTVSNLREWFAAGAIALGMGSKLITAEILQSKGYGQIRELTAGLVKAIQDIRNNP